VIFRFCSELFFFLFVLGTNIICSLIEVHAVFVQNEVINRDCFLEIEFVKVLAIPACFRVHSIYLEHQCFWGVADPGLLLSVTSLSFSFLSPCFNQIPSLVAKLNRAHFSDVNRHIVAASIHAYTVVGSWTNEVFVKNIRVHFFLVSFLIFELKLDLDGRNRRMLIFRPLPNLVF